MICRLKLEYDRQEARFHRANHRVKLLKRIFMAATPITLTMLAIVRLGYVQDHTVLEALRAANYAMMVVLAVGMAILGHSTWTILDVVRFFKRASTSPSIKGAPGTVILKTLRFLLPRKTYERLVLQIVADHREEYFDAVWNGESHHARWIVVRMHGILIMNLLLTALSGMIGKLLSAALKVIGPS